MGSLMLSIAADRLGLFAWWMPRPSGSRIFRGTVSILRRGIWPRMTGAFLFLMDYAHARRVKIWGRARMVNDPDVIARLMPEGYAARPEQALLFTVAAWGHELSAAYSAQGEFAGRGGSTGGAWCAHQGARGGGGRVARRGGIVGARHERDCC